MPFVTADRTLPGTDHPWRDQDELLSVVYQELRRLAAAYMRRERPGQTLQATALVNEAYIKLAQNEPAWTNQQHYVGIAARAMRQILVERARARGAHKRWAGLNRVTLSETLVGAALEDAMLPALDEALARLEQIDPEQARIVELRYFVGLSNEETAKALDVSPATVKRRWSMARAWLPAAALEPVEQVARKLRWLSDPRGLYAHCFCTPSVSPPHR